MTQKEKEELRNLPSNSPRLLNQTQLAAALGVTMAFTSAMKKWGCPFPGGRILIKDALAWLKANPEFARTKNAKALPALTAFRNATLTPTKHHLIEPHHAL